MKNSNFKSSIFVAKILNLDWNIWTNVHMEWGGICERGSPGADITYLKVVASSNHRNAFYCVCVCLYTWYIQIIFGRRMCMCAGIRVLNLIFNWKPEKGSLYRWKTVNFTIKCTVPCICCMYASLYGTLMVFMLYVASV